MKWRRWPIALAAAGALFAGSFAAAREGFGIAGPLVAIGAVLVGAWIVMEGDNDDRD